MDDLKGAFDGPTGKDDDDGIIPMIPKGTDPGAGGFAVIEDNTDVSEPKDPGSKADNLDHPDKGMAAGRERRCRALSS